MSLAFDMAMPIQTSAAVVNQESSYKNNCIQVINPLDVVDWDLQMHNLEAATFFHSVSWLRILQDCFGYIPFCLVEKTHNSLTGVMPLAEVSSSITGVRGIALPFADFCPPLAKDQQTAERLFRQAMDLGLRRRWKTIEWRGQPIRISEPSHDLGSRTSIISSSASSCAFLTHILDLNPGLDRLFNNLESSVRRAIRKAENNGLKAKVTQSEEAVEIFHQLYCLTRQKHGLPPQRLKFFRHVHRHIIAQNNGFIVQADFNDRPVAAAIFFTFGKKAIYKYGASDSKFQSLRANNIVMWAAVKNLVSQGIETLHFGRTSLANEGLRRFKKGWGTVEETLNYYCYDLKTSQLKALKDNAQGWHTRLFRHIPISMSRLLGAIIYRHSA